MTINKFINDWGNTTMKTSDFLNPVTVEGLNKELQSKFGQRVNVGKYSKSQLEDYSKAIEAKLQKFSTKNKFNESLNNEEYQKTLLIKKIVEAAINQYIENPIEEDDVENDILNVQEDDVDVAKDFSDKEEKDGEPNQDAEKQVMQKQSQIMTALKDLTDDPNNARRAIVQIMKGKPLNPMQIKSFGEVLQKLMLPFLEKGQSGITRLKAPIKAVGGSLESIGESVVTEGAEDTAAVIMAAKDMVDKFTAFLEDVAQMSAEGMLELADSIRDELGEEQSKQFTSIVGPALEGTIENLKATREQLTQGVGVLTGEGAPVDTIGAEPEGGEEADMEPIDPEQGPEEPATDEFGASDAAAGGAEPAGREKRESYQTTKSSITESNRIFRKLAK